MFCILKQFLRIFFLASILPSILLAHAGHVTLGFGSISGFGPSIGASLSNLSYKFSHTFGCDGIIFDGNCNKMGTWQSFPVNSGRVTMLSLYYTGEYVFSTKQKLQIRVPLVYNQEDRARIGIHDESAALPGTNTSYGIGDVRLIGSIMALQQDPYSPNMIFTGGLVLPTGKVILDTTSSEISTGGGSYNLFCGLTIGKIFPGISISYTFGYELSVAGMDIPNLDQKANIKFNNMSHHSVNVAVPIHSVPEEKKLPQLEGWQTPLTQEAKRPVVSGGFVLQEWDIVYSQEQQVGSLSVITYIKEHKSQLGPFFEIRPEKDLSIYRYVFWHPRTANIYS